MSTAKIELLRQTQIHYFSCYDKYYELYEKETNTHSTAKLQLKCISTKNIVFEESYTFSLNKQTHTQTQRSVVILTLRLQRRALQIRLEVFNRGKEPVLGQRRSEISLSLS